MILHMTGYDLQAQRFTYTRVPPKLNPLYLHLHDIHCGDYKNPDSDKSLAIASSCLSLGSISKESFHKA